MPYSLVIADDEKIILDGLVKNIDWASLGFEIVGLFDDGEKVIECLNSMPVDVVLTDIRMNYCGGIEIAKFIKESELPCKVVFISGYKEFDLALEAIKYDVKEFIMKPSKEEEILTAFRNIRKDLDRQASDIEFQRKVDKQWKNMFPMLSEKFISGLIMGALDNKEDISHRMHALYPEVNAEKCPCVLINLRVCITDVDSEDSWKTATEQLLDAIEAFPQHDGEAGYPHVIYRSHETVKLFIIMKTHGNTKQDNIEQCGKYIQLLSNYLSELLCVGFSVESECYFENVFAVAEQQDKIIKMSTRQMDMDLHVQEQKKMILMNIMQGNLHVAQKMMNTILEGLLGYDDRYLKNYVADVMSSISELLRENNYGAFQSIQPYIEYCNMMDMTSVHDVIKYCNRIFEKMKYEMRVNTQEEKADLVDQIKRYVKEHIEQDILLEDVAGEVFLTTRHLSRVFKKQTGETFLQYVTRKKMEKAVELLHDSEYRVYHIAQKLGYKTPRYFSKLFFNYSGYYPNQYRKEILGMSDGEIKKEE